MARAGHGFKRAHIDLRHTQAENLTGVQSLPDLIHFNAQNNPGHSFCLQAEPNRASETDDDSASSKRPRYNIRNISMRDLDQALRSCISSLNQLLSLPEYGADNEVAPVALYMESNVGLFIHLAALLEMRIPVRHAIFILVNLHTLIRYLGLAIICKAQPLQREASIAGDRIADCAGFSSVS